MRKKCHIMIVWFLIIVVCSVSSLADNNNVHTVSAAETDKNAAGEKDIEAAQGAAEQDGTGTDGTEETAEQDSTGAGGTEEAAEQDGTGADGTEEAAEQDSTGADGTEETAEQDGTEEFTLPDNMEIKLREGEAYRISIDRMPEDSTVTFEAADNTVAVVGAEGTVIGLKKGSTVITIKLRSEQITGETECSVTVKAQKLKNIKKNWKYKNNGDTAVITAYKGEAESPVIPAHIGKRRVVGIGAEVFRENAVIKTVLIPEGIESIGEYAFSGSSIERIAIPESVKQIGAHIFEGCNLLSEIKLPGSIAGISEYAFYECEALNKVELSKGLKEIGNYAFSGCGSLESIKIPKGMKRIGDGAFSECEKLREIVLRKGLKRIGEKAFSKCTSLTEIELPKGITGLGRGFISESAIESISIPGTVKQINSYTFEESDARADIHNLTSVILEEGVREIGGYAFNYCYNITSLVIPKTVDKVGKGDYWYANIFVGNEKVIVQIPEGSKIKATLEGYGIAVEEYET